MRINSMPVWIEWTGSLGYTHPEAVSGPWEEQRPTLKR